MNGRSFELKPQWTAAVTITVLRLTISLALVKLNYMRETPRTADQYSLPEKAAVKIWRTRGQSAGKTPNGEPSETSRSVTFRKAGSAMGSWIRWRRRMLLRRHQPAPGDGFRIPGASWIHSCTTPARYPIAPCTQRVLWVRRGSKQPCGANGISGSRSGSLEPKDHSFLWTAPAEIKEANWFC